MDNNLSRSILENVRMIKRLSKFEKNILDFCSSNTLERILASRGRISLHRSLPSKRRFIKPEERDCIWRRATDITRVAENWTWLAFQVIRIFGSSSLFNVATTKLARRGFSDELFHFRMSAEIVRSGGTITRQFARVNVVRKVSIVPC